MTTDASWNPARWRDGHRLQHSPFDSSLASQAPQLSTPTAINAVSLPRAFLGRSSPNALSWDARSSKNAEDKAFGLPPLTTDFFADAPTHYSGSRERHSPPPCGNCGPQQLTNASLHQTFAGPWRSLQHDEPQASAIHITDTPPPLRAPKTRNLPRVPPAYNTPHPESQSYFSSQKQRSQPTPLLPSFASFQETASRSNDSDIEGPELASVSSGLSCYVCTKLKPMMTDVAIAVAELDENVQTLCNNTVTRIADCPENDLVRAAQWIFERLRSAKFDLQHATRRSQSGYFHQASQQPVSAGPSHPASPLNSLKRSAEYWFRDDLPWLKRPRSGASADQPSRMLSADFAPREDHRASIDFAREHLNRAGFYSPPNDSVPTSAYPRHGSPTQPGRSAIALPSPSSLAYPPSAAPSVPGPPAPSIGSPAISYQPASSIHTASTNSATSAHIADLQHQVTFKSLALQTLQSEYASLLQKLQRERVKSQAIENKTNVADQEVNDLTGKNEELSEQLKNLATQLEQCEKKREVERAEAAREKEQWGRMLDMGGQLQAKTAKDKQKLADEKEELLKRIAVYEGDNFMRFDQIRQGLTSNSPNSRRGSGGSDGGGVEKLDSMDGFSGNVSSSLTNLKQEILLLETRNQILRSSVQEAQRYNSDLEEKARGILRESTELGTLIDQALQDDQSASTKPKPTVADRLCRAASGHSTPSRQQPAWSPTVLPTFYADSVKEQLRPIVVSEHTKPTDHINNFHALAAASDTAKGGSSGSPEAAFYVQPSRPSPEEFIEALGTVDSPTPSAPYGPVMRGPSAIIGDWRAVSDQQPYHQVLSPYASVHRTLTHAEESPHSYHSSPGPMVRDEDISSSSSSVKYDSSEANVWDRKRSKTTDDIQTASRSPSLAKAGFRSLRSYQNEPKGAAAAMPPPPKPFT